jgi:hypothetical protein
MNCAQEKHLASSVQAYGIWKALRADRGEVQLGRFGRVSPGKPRQTGIVFPLKPHSGKRATIIYSIDRLLGETV